MLQSYINRNVSDKLVAQVPVQEVNEVCRAYFEESMQIHRILLSSLSGFHEDI
jgi:hypothetical protein